MNLRADLNVTHEAAYASTHSHAIMNSTQLCADFIATINRELQDAHGATHTDVTGAVVPLTTINAPTLAHEINIASRSCLSLVLLMVPLPHKFRTSDLPRYSGETDPEPFTRIYKVTVNTMGGGEAAMWKIFLLSLTDVVQSWLLNLPPRTIFSWEQLKDMLRSHFKERKKIRK